MESINFLKSYGIECDNWSLGVIMYLLLCGVPPFISEDTASVYLQIRRAKINFEEREWDHISKEAKELVLLLLQPDPYRRYTS